MLASGCFLSVQDVSPLNDAEFLITARPVSIIGIPGQAYMLSCKDVKDPVGEQVTCQRILTGPEVLSLAPGESASGRGTLTVSEKK